MATTRTPGVTVLADGRRFIDKRYLGVRIGLRVGAITQEQAEERLDIEIASSAMRPRPKGACAQTFTDSAARYLAQSRSKRSIDVIKWDVTLLQWLDTHMKNCFTRRGGDGERRTDKPQKTVRRRVGVALKGLILKYCLALNGS
jgi:hypothetical protein